MATEIADVLDNPAERARLSAAGRARMLSHHSWTGAMQRFDELVADCLATRRREARITSS